ncbi:MAG: hypothetical protein WCW02_00955 [Candidatus Buchananbacteria bacterium]
MISEDTTNPDLGSPILSFEEFSLRGPDNRPRYENFFLFFAKADPEAYDGYHDKLCYKKFIAENPELNQILNNKVQAVIDSKILSRSKSFKEFDDQLYEAYKIMRGYGVSDEELFG